MDWYEKQRVGDLPRKAAALYGSREALVAGDRRWSFVQFDAEVDRISRALVAAGVDHGDRVAVWLANRAEWIFLAFALARIGAVLVPLNTRYRTIDLAQVLRHCECSTLILSDRSGPVDFLAMLAEAFPELDRTERDELPVAGAPALRRVFVIGEAGVRATRRWGDLLDGAPGCSPENLALRESRVQPDDVLLVAYTSGTTGAPKGVMHGHCCIRNVVDGASRLGVTSSDVIVNYLPMFHLYAYSACALTSMITGARQVLLDVFDAEAALDLVEREGVTLIHGFDAHYRDLMAAQSRRPRDLRTLRLGTFPAGMANSAPTAARVQQELCPTVSVYGMTELWTFPTLSFLDSTPEQRSEASGYPMPGYDIRIVDPDSGEELPPGTPGEIRVHGYMVTRGYFRDPAATAAAFDERGRFRTGDRGMIRADGHLRFLGRAKDMLKVGGENVSPAEVEAYLLQLPGVVDAAVVGCPDDRLGEVPVAFIRCAPGTTVGDDDVVRHCRHRIASFKVPRRVFVLDEFPMTPTGKVQKHLLRSRIPTPLRGDTGGGASLIIP
jgi:fatty-acyl-CoA synthase